MPKKLLKILLIFVVTTTFGCGKELDDKDLIKALIEDAALSASEKDVRGVMKHFSKDYLDDRGYNYKNIKGIVFSQIIRKDTLRVFTRSIKVQVDGVDALASANVILARGQEVESVSDIIPDQSAGYRFNFILKKIDGDWLITSADWTDVGARALL